VDGDIQEPMLVGQVPNGSDRFIRGRGLQRGTQSADGGVTDAVLLQKFQWIFFSSCCSLSMLPDRGGLSVKI
jgi:hypothetical protein